MKYSTSVKALVVSAVLLVSVFVAAAAASDLWIEDVSTCVWKKGPGGFIFSGYALCFEVVVGNAGTTAAGPSHLGLFFWVDLGGQEVDGYTGIFSTSYMMSIPPVLPGGSTSVVQFNFPMFGPPGQPPAGEFPEHYFLLTVDSTDRVPEVDETNNTKQVRLMLVDNPCEACQEERCKEFTP